MKLYLIYNDKDKFLGYSETKELMNKFLKYRKGTYKTYTIKSKHIPDTILYSYDFERYQLVEYRAYQPSSKVILFNYEAYDMENMLDVEGYAGIEGARAIKNSLSCLRLTDEEVKMITVSMDILIEALTTVMSDEERDYDEVFNVEKFFNKRFIK